MKELVVLSGKGGTGKTVLVASFATLADSKVMVDCDVDAADLHLLLHPKVGEAQEFWGGKTAYIDHTRCTRCELCEQMCNFDAIQHLKVDPIACEGCGFCARICPEDTIKMNDNLAGHWFISDTRYGPLVHARLGIAEENSGKLVALCRQQARGIAQEGGMDYIISDGPPGIGCPAISSLSGADMALLVTEPTMSGMHDLERVMGLCRHFGVPAKVCINKFDINEDNSQSIERLCGEMGVEVVAMLPFDSAVTEALVKGMTVVEYAENGIASAIAAMWHRIEAALA